MIDFLQQFDEEPDSDNVTCNRCGTAGLYWQEVTKGNGTQRSELFSTATRRKHVCVPQADAFPSLA